MARCAVARVAETVIFRLALNGYQAIGHRIAMSLPNLLRSPENAVNRLLRLRNHLLPCTQAPRFQKTQREAVTATSLSTLARWSAESKPAAAAHAGSRPREEHRAFASSEHVGRSLRRKNECSQRGRAPCLLEVLGIVSSRP